MRDQLPGPIHKTDTARIKISCGTDLHVKFEQDSWCGQHIIHSNAQLTPLLCTGSICLTALWIKDLAESYQIRECNRTPFCSILINDIVKQMESLRRFQHTVPAHSGNTSFSMHLGLHTKTAPAHYNYIVSYGLQI